jgi:hypothetical protein
MKNLLIISALAAILAGCGPTLYVPNTVNTPLLAEKKDWKASIGVIGMAPEANVDLQGSYAFHDHFAAMGNMSFMAGHNDQGSQAVSNLRNSHSLVEGGVGAYTSFWKNRRGVPIGRAEIFGGTGVGWAEDNNPDNVFNVDGTDRYLGVYQRYFLQPSVGIRSRIVDISFATRISRVHFSSFKHYEDGSLTENSSFGFPTAEPVLTLSLGYKYVKYYMQVGSIETQGNPENFQKVTDYLTSGSHFNLGLVGCPWHEKPIEKPGIALEPATEKQENKAGHETLPTVINVQQPKVTICLPEGGSPDGDVVSASFNGAFVAQQIELTKRPQCFEVEPKLGEENLLQIHAVSDGKFKPNTVQVTVKDGKRERTFYLRTEAGKTEEIRLRLD